MIALLCSPGVVKTDCTVLDFGISTILHGTLEQSIDPDARLAAVSRDHGNGDVLKDCPACGAHVPLVAAECPFCGERLIDDVTRLMNFDLVEVSLFDRSNLLEEVLGEPRCTLCAKSSESQTLRHH